MWKSENSYAKVIHSTCCSRGVIPRTTVCKHVSLQRYTAATQHTSNMEAVNMADRLTTASPHVPLNENNCTVVTS